MRIASFRPAVAPRRVAVAALAGMLLACVDRPHPTATRSASGDVFKPGPAVASLDPALDACPAPTLNSSGFSGTWSGFKNEGYQLATDTTVADGWSARRQWAATSVGQAAGVSWSFTGERRVYARWRYRQDDAFNNGGTHNVVKFIRPGWWGGVGLLQVSGDRFRWLYEQLDRNNTYYQNDGPEVRPSALRGSWHWFEVMNDISTSGALRMKLWIDGELKMNHVVAQPSQSLTIGIVEIGGEFQAPVPAGTDWYDDIALSVNCITIPSGSGGGVSPVPVGSVTVSPSAVTLYGGQQTTLVADVRDQNGAVVTDRPVGWSSSNNSIATVTATGTVMAAGLGTATITATSETRSGTATITVSSVPVAAVTVTPASTALVQNETVQLVATTTDSAGGVLTGRSIAWSTSNAAVANVSATGLVAATGAGSATIIATSEGKSGTASVSVTAAAAPVASVSVSPTSATRIVGGTVTLTATPRDAAGNALSGRVITWQSANSAVASVDANGVVTGVASGNATITATSEGQISSPATITIAPVLGGSVVNLASNAVGGGIVEILSGTTVVQTVPVSSAGTYAVNTLPAGSYGVRLHPPLTHSMGPAEPAQRSATITSTQSTPTTVSFVVQSALWADDFQAYTTTSLKAGCGQYTGNISSGAFFSGAGHDMGCSGTSQITIDPAGGPGGTSKAMRYDWAAKPAYTPLAAYCASETTINLAPRFYPSPSFSPSDTLWIRFSSKESAGFQHGGPSCGSTAGLAYKFFLVLLEKAGAYSRFGTYLFPRTSGSATDATLGVDMSEGVNRASSGSSSGPIGAGSNGVYRTYHIQIFNLGTTSTTFRVYMNGVKISELVGPIFPGSSVGGSGWALTLALGANINNGPEQAQSRWFREIAVYRTRPSMRPLPP